MYCHHAQRQTSKSILVPLSKLSLDVLSPRFQPGFITASSSSCVLRENFCVTSFLIVVSMNATLWSECGHCVCVGQHSRRNASLRKTKKKASVFSGDETDQERETVKACRTSHYSVRVCVCVHSLSTYTTHAPSILIPLCLRQRWGIREEHKHTHTTHTPHTLGRASAEERGAVICQQGTLAARRCHGNCLLPRTGFASQGPQIGSKASEVPPLLHPTHLRLSLPPSRSLRHIVSGSSFLPDCLFCSSLAESLHTEIDRAREPDRYR